MRPLDPWPRLAFFAVILPAALAVFDRWLLAGPPRILSTEEIVGTFAAFAIQVALLGWIVGRGLQNPVLRWTVFVWALLLINVQIISVALDDQQWESPAKALAYAMLSAQAGLLAAWAALGELRWTWRLPIALAAAAGLGCFLLLVNESYFAPWWRYSLELWPVVLLAQSAAALALCLALAWAGYRMKTPDENANPYEDLGERKQDRRLQFSLKNLMIWITALGPVILVFRGLNVWMTARYGIGQWIEIIILALCLASVSLLAVWAAAGAEGALLRIPLLLLLSPTIGALLGGLALRGWWDRMGGFTYMTGWEEVFYWIVWTTLAGYFLAGMLLVFRAQGCRLQRTVPRRLKTAGGFDERATAAPSRIGSAAQDSG
jgi:hypothetical protein